MERTAGVLCMMLWILGFVLVDCNAGKKWQKDEEKEKSITCYDCNSEYDSNCADPFNNYTLGTVDCSARRPPEHMLNETAALCRKIVQRVHGKLRIIRGCGYKKNSYYDDKACMKRSGTHEVQMLYCSCSTSLCNIGHLGIRPSINLIIAIMLAPLLFNIKQTYVLI